MFTLRYVAPGRIVAEDGEPIADMQPTLSSNIVARLGREMAAGPQALDLLRRAASELPQASALVAEIRALLAAVVDR